MGGEAGQYCLLGSALGALFYPFGRDRRSFMREFSCQLIALDSSPHLLGPFFRMDHGVSFLVSQLLRPPMIPESGSGS